MVDELPFLVVHGAIVWKVLLLALVGGTAAMSIAIRNWRARRVARARTKESLRDARSLVDGRTCVRGVLRGGSLYTLSNGAAFRDHLEGAPWLDCADGVCVDIAGAGHVAVGSRATSSTLRVPKGTPKELADVKGAWVLTSVREGDELVVRGVATRTQQDVASYREDAMGWALEDDIIVCAVKPAALAQPRHAIAQAFMLLAVSCVCYGPLHKVGSVAASRVDKPPALGDLREIPSFGALSIACAMPSACSGALESERRWYFERYGNRGSALGQFDALWQSDPCGLAGVQVRQVRLEPALASARACGDRAYEAWIQLFLGNYRAALDLAPQRAIVREYAAVGVGDWKIAAEAAEAIAARPKESHEDVEYFALGTAATRCRAAWYRHLAGSADAFANVDVKTGACGVLAALARPEQEQRDLLLAVVKHERGLDIKDQDWVALSRANAILAMLGGVEPDHRQEIDVAFGVDPEFWLTAFETPSSPALEGRAGIVVMRGDFAAAHAAANAITDAQRRDTVRKWIALREGTQPPADGYRHAALDEPLALRSGTIPKDEGRGVYPEECEPRLLRGVEAALAGDGRLLAGVFTDCHVYYDRMTKLLFGILPRVKNGRAELADALRAFRDDLTTFTLDRVPFRLIRDLADTRDLARLVGDVEESNRLQTIIDRHAKLLVDRNRTIAMLMLMR